MSSTFYQNNVQNICVSGINDASQIWVEIVEQPLSDGARFRYKCEGRSAGCIKGVNSTENHKTYTTIKVHGFQGFAGVVVSTVPVDGPPFYPHPHNLVGKHCENGVCRKIIKNSGMTCSFPNLGIQCVTRKSVKESLEQREALRVDPFATGFSHSLEPKKINLNALRLCFQVFLPDSNGKLCIPLPPVISEPIYDNKTVSYLTIANLSHDSASVTGGQEVILLCDPVKKDDIEICFYEEKESDKEIVWSAKGTFFPHDVHRKVAISFKTPAYKDINIQQKVNCFIHLRQPSDGAVGKPVEFTLLPLKEATVCQIHPMRIYDAESKPPELAPASRYESYNKNVPLPLNIPQVLPSTAVVQPSITSPSDFQNVNNTLIATTANSELKNSQGSPIPADDNLDKHSNMELSTNSTNSVVSLSGISIDSVQDAFGLFYVGLIDKKSFEERICLMTF